MAKLSPKLRIGSAVAGAYFLFGALVQLNDPDPARWIAIYVAAAALSFAAVRAALPPVWPGLVAAVAFVWALTWLPGALQTSFPEMFRTYRMMSDAMEEGREELGLLIIAAWMITLAIASKRQRLATP